MLYWCGIRLGELLALTYADIDFDRKTISISKSYQRINGEDYITDPKTPKSKRIVSIPDNLCQRLKEYMGLQYSYKMNDRMFLMSKSFLNRNLKIIAEKAKRENVLSLL